MLKNLTKKTRRKFYNKWLYKVTLNVKGATALRIYSRDEITDFLNGSPPGASLRSHYKSKLWGSKNEVNRLINLLDQYEDNLWSQRIENDWIDIYTNDVVLYEDLSTSFEPIIVHRFEPDINILDKLENGKTMVVKKLPHGVYNYRAYLLPHKITDRDDRIKFLNWLENQKPRVTCTEAIKKWFLSTKYNWDRRYILVEDEGTLLLLKLKNSDVVGTVYKFEVA